jgi:hypothetical protein
MARFRSRIDRSRTDRTLCSLCYTGPRRPQGRWCHACHAADQAARRARQRAEVEHLRAFFSQAQAPHSSFENSEQRA